MKAYAIRSAEKLPQQGSLCRHVRVSLHFNPNDAKYAEGILCPLPNR
ncbi:hypothetical protein [Pseudomonas psychrophila]|nr:hypothetical protein [Pseudomonas psychrophila]